MTWNIANKYLTLSLVFLNKECLGFIVLYKNFNYKLICRTAPVFKVTWTKEEFKQNHFNTVHKKSVVKLYNWNGFCIYNFGKNNKEYICSERHFVPLKIRM